MQTPPHGVTIVHDTVVFFFYVYTYEWLLMCSFMCGIRGLSMVRTIGAYTAHTEHHYRYIIYFTQLVR